MKLEQVREKKNNRIVVIQIIIINHTVNKKKEEIDYMRFNIIKTRKMTTKKIRFVVDSFLLLYKHIIEKKRGKTPQF